MKIRTLKAEDYKTISPQINDWWGGRQMSDMLPKLFFVHFNETSFVVEKDGEIAGFLVGFLSQTFEDEAYIHFVGIHPDYRKQNIARELYERFFDTVKKKGRSVVRCVTSPVNKTSIAYHQKMGFVIENPGVSQDRVLFVKEI